jgi:hypothetical protein
MDVGAARTPTIQRRTTTIELDIAKSTFQGRGVDAAGQEVIQAEYAVLATKTPEQQSCPTFR